MITPRRITRRGRFHAGIPVATGTLLLTLCMHGPVLADSKDGNFPTADQVGGEVFPKGIQVGDTFPTNWDIYDDNGRKVDLGKLIKGKRSILAFFISAVPVSVDELKKLEKATGGSNDTQLLFVNTDLVGGKLQGVDPIAETARTVRVIRQEKNIKQPMFVAPNDALSEHGLSNVLGFRGLPTVYVVNEKGAVENVYVGPQNWTKTNI